MRNFKIIIVTILFLLIAGLALLLLKGVISSPSAVPPESYWEDGKLPSPSDLYGKTLKQYEGVVKEAGVSIYMEGTHRLEKDGVLVSLLDSKKINLPDFVGKAVKLRGFVKDTVEGGAKIMMVDFIEITRDEGVKVFQEEGFQFSFSYPGEWEKRLEDNKVTFQMNRSQELETIMIAYQYAMVKAPLDIWLKDRDQNLSFEETTVKVGDTTGVRRSIRNGEQVIVKTYVKGGNNIYELRLIAQDDASRTQYYSIVDFFRTNSGEGVSESNPDAEALEIAESEAFVTEPLTAEESENSSSGPSPVVSSVLTPLSPEEIGNTIEKGFTAFQGKSLQFEYPRVWYFSHLGNQVYGFTDKIGYEKGNSEVLKEFSRILLIPEERTESCAYQKKVSTWIVCAKEPALSSIVDQIAGSVR